MHDNDRESKTTNTCVAMVAEGGGGLEGAAEEGRDGDGDGDVFGDADGGGAADGEAAVRPTTPESAVCEVCAGQCGDTSCDRGKAGGTANSREALSLRRAKHITNAAGVSGRHKSETAENRTTELRQRKLQQ